MTISEARNKKRKEVAEAIILRQEPVHVVTRVFNEKLDIYGRPSKVKVQKTYSHTR